MMELPPSEQDMELLTRDLDALEEEFKAAKAVSESLKSLLAVESENRRAAETLCAAHVEEKARLRKLQEDTLAQAGQQVDYRSKYETLWQQVNLKTEQDNVKEKEHEKVEWTLKEKLQHVEQETGSRISFLENQLHLKQASVTKLEQEIAQLHEDLDILAQTYHETRQKDQSEFQQELSKLRSELSQAREANRSLQSQLQSQEQSSMMEKSRLESQIQELSSNWHVGALKQKLMKLRKENEDLKRQFKSNV